MNKALATLTITLFSSISFAFGAELEGFLDLPWGATPEAAKKQIPSRTRARFERQESDDNHLRFGGGKFAGFNVDRIDLSFSETRFFRAEVRLETKDTEREFTALKTLLTEKYGAPGRDESGKHECTWYFPVTGKPANVINLYAAPKGNGLLIFYMSETSKTPAAAVNGPAGAPKPARTSADAVDDL